MKAAPFVFDFPAFEFASQIPFIVKQPSLVELLRIDFMAALHFAVDLRASRWNVEVRDAGVGKMPSELWSKR